MQQKYIFQTVPEHEKHRLSRAFVDVEWLCSRVEPQKEREKWSLVQVCECLTLLEPAIQSTTSPWSAVNFKEKQLSSIWSNLSPRCGHVILVSGYLVLTGVNWPNHWCPISKLVTVSNGVLPPGWALNLSLWYIYVYWSHWHTWRGGRTDVRTYGRSWRHGYKTKFSHIDRLPYFLKVAQNSFQHIPRLRFWCVIIATLHQLMLQSWYQKTAQSLVNTLVLFLWHNRLP